LIDYSLKHVIKQETKKLKQFVKLGPDLVSSAN